METLSEQHKKPKKLILEERQTSAVHDSNKYKHTLFLYGAYK